MPVEGGDLDLVVVVRAVGALAAIYVAHVTEALLVGVLAPVAAAGVVFAAANALRGQGAYDAHNNNEVEIAALYWHFVDLIWILVFTFVYLI